MAVSDVGSKQRQLHGLTSSNARIACRMDRGTQIVHKLDMCIVKISFAAGIAAESRPSGSVSPSAVTGIAHAASPTSIYAFGGAEPSTSNVLKSTYKFSMSETVYT